MEVSAPLSLGLLVAESAVGGPPESVIARGFVAAGVDLLALVPAAGVGKEPFLAAA